MDIVITFCLFCAVVVIVAGGKFAADGFFKKNTFESHEEFLKARREEMERWERKHNEELRKKGEIR